MAAESIPQIIEAVPQIAETIAQIEETIPETTEIITQATETVAQMVDVIQKTDMPSVAWQEVISNWSSWIVGHEVQLNLAISLLSFIVTSVLTVVIIGQTSKLAKQQSEQEKHINKQQEDLQKRQMRIDTFDYKNNIYHALYRVFQMTGEIEDIFSKIGLRDKTMEQLYQMFEIIREQLKIDVSEMLWLFKQAKYILPSNIYPSVRDIADNFNELTGDIGKLKFFPTILAPDEIEEEKQQLLRDIEDRAKCINQYVIYIESVMPRELDISSLEK